MEYLKKRKEQRNMINTETRQENCVQVCFECQWRPFSAFTAKIRSIVLFLISATCMHFGRNNFGIKPSLRLQICSQMISKSQVKFTKKQVSCIVLAGIIQTAQFVEHQQIQGRRYRRANCSRRTNQKDAKLERTK